MTTLIAVYNSSGCVGRCDAKCYNATDAACECICGGKNHGAGLRQATQNTCELAEDWIRQSGLDPSQFQVPVLGPQQLSLFDREV